MRYAAILLLILTGTAGCSDALGPGTDSPSAPAYGISTSPGKPAYGISTSPGAPVPGISTTPRP